MRDRCQPDLRDLHVVLQRVEARPDGADHLAINNDRKSTLHFREALCRDGCNATVVDRVLKRLTRFLEQRGCSGLARGKFDAGEIGGMVHALDQDRPPTVVDHGNDTGPVIARPPLPQPRRPFAQFPASTPFFGKLRGRSWRQRYDRSEQKSAGDADTHDDLS